MSYTVIDRRSSASLPTCGVKSTLVNTADPAPACAPGPVWGGTSFDGAGDSPMRSQALVSMNSAWEITMSQLRAMQVKSRALRNNLHVFRNIIKTLVEFSIGYGLIPVPRSGNKNYDSRAKAYWMRLARSKACDIRRKQDHCSQQTTACSDMMVDGEIFRVKKLDAMGRPVRQFFRTEQSGGLFGGSLMSDGWFNGIQYDEDGAALRYQFRKSLNSGLPLLGAAGQVYESRHVQHIFDMERSNQQRGLPWAYSDLNGGLDAIDIDSLAKAKDKINAALFEAIETPTGTVPNSFANMGGAGGQGASWEGTKQFFPTKADFPGTGNIALTYVDSSTEKQWRWTGTIYVEINKRDAVRFLNIHGTMIPLFRTGEKIVPHDGGSTMNAREMLEFLFNGLAVSFNVPVQLFWNMAGIGGAATRGTLELGKRTFDRVQRIMVSEMCQDDYENVIGHGILAYLYPTDFPGVEPLEPPPGMNGWNCSMFRGPQDLTVDKGREGRMFLELIRAGLMSREEWWTRNNEDPEEMEAVPTRELAARRQAWLDEGLPEDKFWLREFGASGTLSVREQEQGPDPEPGAIGNFSVEELADALAGLLKDHAGRRV